MKKYIGKLELSTSPFNPYTPDGEVQIEEHVVFYRHEPYLFHELKNALKRMSNEEQIKVMRYITRITNKRIKFELLIKERPWSAIDFYQYPEKFGIIKNKKAGI